MDGDESVLDEALSVLQEARERAPRDFLFGLAAALGCGGLALVVVGLAFDGVVHDLSLNMGVQVIGTWLTVVLIDGLWKRQDVGASVALDAMRRRLEQRKGSPMAARERQAWRSFVDDYRRLARSESTIARIFSLPTYARQLKALEERARGASSLSLVAIALAMESELNLGRRFASAPS